MTSGKFREKITFQRRGSDGQTTPSDATDEFGNPIDDYGNSEGEFEDFLTVWGDVMERLGGEKVRAGLVQSEQLATIRVRRSTATLGITEADRIIARGQPWNIRSIAEVGNAKRTLDFLCEGGVAT